MMGKKPKKPKPLTFLEAYQRIRKSWGDINPVTKVKPNKKRKSRAQNKRDFKKDIDDV
jgi:hypothetical protein